MTPQGQPSSKTSNEAPALGGGAEGGAVLKVKFALKAATFCASVMTLSWFFEGWRRIHEGIGVWSVSLLLAGVVFTTALVVVQAFWIYAEEKQKGSLLRRIAVFDRLYEGLVQRKLAQDAQKGEKANHA